MKFFYDFYLFFLNKVVASIPSYTVRHFFYKVLGKIVIGKFTNIQMGLILYKPWRIVIGKNTVINNNVLLDGRGQLIIGNNVNISPFVKIFTAEHDLNDPLFKYVEDKVVVKDYAWISTNAIILPGVQIGEGAVVASGAVVTKNVAPYTIVGGVPAKKIGHRNSNLSYELNYRKYFH